ncbi:hypothetical protein [Streptomyces clavuligerus]|nr:hypothetical protein [Streptomyces clavuligerus]
MTTRSPAGRLARTAAEHGDAGEGLCALATPPGRAGRAGTPTTGG